MFICENFIIILRSILQDPKEKNTYGYGNVSHINKKTEKMNYHFSKDEEEDFEMREKGRKKFPPKQTEILQANIFFTPDNPL